MNFFRVNDLAKRLAKEEVSERQQFGYFLIFTLLTTLNYSYWLSDYVKNDSVLDYISDITMIVVVFVGTIISYKINCAGDAKNFISRSICLSLPILVQTIVFMIPIFLVLVIFEEFYERLNIFNEITPTSIVDIILLGLMCLFFYTRLAFAMKLASQPPQINEEEE